MIGTSIGEMENTAVNRGAVNRVKVNRGAINRDFTVLTYRIRN